MYTQTTGSILQIVGGVSADVFALLAFLFILLAVGLAKGKDLLIIFILAVYPSALAVVYFPFYEHMVYIPGFTTPALPELFVFIVFLFVGIAVFRGYIDTGYQQHTFWRYVELIALSLSAVILTISTLYHIIEIQHLYNFSPMINAVFASEKSFFFCLLAPFVIIPSFVRP